MYTSLINAGLKRVLNTRAVKNKKLHDLVTYAKANSDLYKELYADVDVSGITIGNIERLPITNKEMMVNRFDDWICDKTVTKDKLAEFMEDSSNVGKLFDGRYKIIASSGTGGVRIALPLNEKEFQTMASDAAVNTWPKLQYPKEILFSKRPLVYILPMDDFFTTTALSSDFLKFSSSDKSTVLDVHMPKDQIIAKLNELNPILIGGYVGSFLLLAEAQREGLLHISPEYMVSAGTSYSLAARNEIINTFKCKTFTSYFATETGEMGHECECGCFHLNDNVIIEAVDENDNPVPYGTVSDHILVTNLWYKTAPLIRYRINDKCILHREKCTCGKRGLTIEILGRESFFVSFTDNTGKTVKFSSANIATILDKVCRKCAGYQMTVNNNEITLKFLCEDTERAELFEEAKSRLQEYLYLMSISCDIRLSDEDVVLNASGKMQEILNITEEMVV